MAAVTHTALLQDLTIVMAAAAAMTFLCHRFRQPVVLGYLVAGLIIGPHIPPFSLIKDLQSIHTMAELGLVFLMFALGLEFNLPKLGRVGFPAAVAGLLQIGVMFLIGAEVGGLLGWGRADRVFLGAMLSISSTTIIVKVLMDLKKEKEGFSQVVFGILIIEDLAAVALLSLLPGLGSGTASSGAAAAGIFQGFFRIGFFALFFLVAGLFLAPRLLGWVSRFRSREALGVTALGLCLVGAASAALAGFSVALGAFLAGAVVAASDEAERVESWFHPVQDMFSALFFVAAGMLMDPAALWQHKTAVLAVTAATVLGKVLAVTGGSLLAGFDLRTALRIGLSMGQIGEFSFVIAGLGAASSLTSAFLYPVAVGVSTLTTLFTPVLIRRADPWAEALERHAPKRFMNALEAYHGWFHARTGGGSRAETLIFSKYLVRLALYMVLFGAAVLVARGLSLALGLWEFLPWGLQDAVQAVLWFSAAAAVLPLVSALAKYADHLVLLLFTWASPPALLVRVNLRWLYVLSDAAIVGFLMLVLAGAAAGAFMDPRVFAGTAAAAIGGAVFSRRWIGYGRERLEKMLDEVLGLATSEPTRQAVLRAGERTLVLHDITEEALVPPGGPAEKKTLAELRLRELTGASVVALYRHGRHTANPGPETRLDAGDVVVLLGDESQRHKAVAIITGHHAV
jgi:monovalent cation:H+ antiporter-2, CPA2 family